MCHSLVRRGLYVSMRSIVSDFALTAIWLPIEVNLQETQTAVSNKPQYHTVWQLLVSNCTQSLNTKITRPSIHPRCNTNFALSNLVLTGPYLCICNVNILSQLNNVALEHHTIYTGQVRSECLTCTFRASCCSARLSRAQVSAFACQEQEVYSLLILFLSNIPTKRE